MYIEDVCKRVFERELRGEPCKCVWVPGGDKARLFNWIAYREACRSFCPDRQIRVGTAFIFFRGDCLVVDADGRLAKAPYYEKWPALSPLMADGEFIEAVTEAEA